jgi:hypothetical protein
MNVNIAVKRAARPFRRLDLARARERRWWLVLVLAAATIVASAFVQKWAECQFLYQAERTYAAARADAYSRPPQPASLPVLTVLLGIAGELLYTAATWGAWSAGLYLASLLLGQREAHLGATFKVVAWSWLPFVARGMVQCVYMALTRDPIYNPGLSGLVWDNTPPPPGGGYNYTMPTQGQQVWAALLAQVDLYLFAHLALIVTGLRGAVGCARRTALAATGIVAGVLGALGLVPVVFDTAFRQFRLF